MTCHFDSVVVSTDRLPATTDVPALSPLGLMVLASVLTIAAFAVLRRRFAASART